MTARKQQETTAEAPDDGAELIAVTSTITLPDGVDGRFVPGDTRQVDPTDPDVQRYLAAGLLVPAGD